MLITTFTFALVVQNEFFEFSNSINGDIDYHRGVALTMVGGMWQGQGPIHSIISYFGGLYPMTLGWGSRALGVSESPRVWWRL